MNNILNSVYIKYEVSVRLCNALRSCGITTLEELVLYIKDNGVSSLLKLRNLGKKSVQEIWELLNRYHITDEDIYSYVPTKINEATDSIIGDANEAETVFGENHVPNVLIGDLQISPRIIERLALNGIRTTVDFVSFCRSCGIANFLTARKYESWAAKELADLFIILCDNTRWNELYKLQKKNDGGKIRIEEISTPVVNMFCNFQGSEYDAAFELVQRYYISNLYSISNRARIVIRLYLPTFPELLIYIKLLNTHAYRLFDRCGELTWREIRGYAVRIINEINRLNSAPPKNLIISMTLEDLSYKCIDENEKQFISDYNVTRGHMPMFYILSSYILRSEGRFEQIYRTAYGILSNQRPLRDIAKAYGLTYERVRQVISVGRLNNKAYIHASRWEPYNIKNILFLSKSSSIYEEVRTYERLDTLTFVGFGYLCKLLEPFTHLAIKDNHYFFSKKLVDSFDIVSAIEDIENTLTKKVTIDVDVPISIFINSYWKSYPDFDHNEVVNILCEVIRDNFDVVIDDNCRITIRQNSVDISGELYQIIKENGKAMSINDIFIEFKKKYPNHKYNSASQLRSYLLKNERICPKGKTSCYALTEWNIYTGTIKDLIYETLFKSDLPLTAEELCVLIHDIYETSPKSVRSTVVADKGGKFIFFKNGYIGLKSKSYPDEYNDVTLGRKPRQSFQDSLAEYERYLATHHHMPFSTGTEVEQFLYKWYGNVIGKRISLNVKQEADFNAMIERNKEYMVNGIEYAFFRRCDDYKVFLEENMELPTLETDATLYNWFQTQIKKYTEFEDRRYGYFEDLLKDIESYGFIVNINKDKGLF